MKALFICIIFVFCGLNEYTAKVIGVTDGDTIVILTDKKEQIKVRLDGIDCPEMKQDFGQRAKQATSDLCFGKEVKIKKTGVDRYGRTLAFVYIGDTCINKYLLETGMAWHYKKYNSDPELANIENMAKQNKVGLWSQSNPIAPWNWRHAKK